MPSTVIRGFAYDRVSGSLEVRFANGRRYRYREVPVEVADEFRGAFVKGRFFNQRIRDCYECEELDLGDES